KGDTQAAGRSDPEGWVICLYSLYLGCIVPNLYPEVERALRDVLSILKIEYSDMRGSACCIPPALFGFQKDVWRNVNLTNFGTAKYDIITVCDECFASLQDAKVSLEREEGKALPNVLPLAKVLKDAEEEARKRLKKPVKLRCAIQHSCHLLRPSEVRNVDDPFYPKLVKSLLDVIGCEGVQEGGGLGCCGGSVKEGSRVSKELATRRMRSAEASGAELVVTTCSHCLKQLARSKRLPVFHLAQLYALALGSSPKSIGMAGVVA
ncbi:MAG: hypothetical protein JTT11_09405, partial [Candidatus Brockarchaeota archaeon]|nr:hypothetical protein [Candidatus Brockarchaeota archaeon]